MSRRLLTLTILLAPATVLALMLTSSNQPTPTAPAQAGAPATAATAAAQDPVARLQQQIASGEVTLEWQEKGGYLRSVLEHLDIPVSSQTLVFAKSSFDLHLISPSTPRALYFNDDVYVGLARGSAVIEFAAIDPTGGAVFYTMEQTPGEPRAVEARDIDCLSACHDFLISEQPVPRLLMLSVLPDPSGYALKAFSMLTLDRSPFRERYGGWYVTGTHGTERHMGNMTVNIEASEIDDIKEYAAGLRLDRGANVTDLTSYFDVSPYLTPHSDIVALMVLAHQTHIHNLIALANHRFRENRDVEEAAENLLRSMLFVGAVEFQSPIAGTTSYAEDFQSRGPQDSKGRSLRDLDLQTRLMKYPLSYMIYSEAFDALPDRIKRHFYTRLREVLSGAETDPNFAHLTAADRTAITEILNDTKADFRDRRYEQ